MADNKNCFHGYNKKDSVCIDCNRVLDSCRDKDCYEDARVYLTDCGQEIINKTNNIRIKSTKVVWTHIGVEPVQFNRGFYQIDIRFYTKLICEGCICPGKIVEFEGLAVTEKKIILYGGEGSVNIFKSEIGINNFCDCPTFNETPMTNAPTVVLEVTDPIALGMKINCETPKCCCCCNVNDLPDCVSRRFKSNICADDYDGNKLYVTLGFFSVVRVERPAQYMIDAAEYTIPDKVCCDRNEEDPCSAFARMSFPVNEFYPPSLRDNGCCD